MVAEFELEGWAMLGTAVTEGGRAGNQVMG